MSMLARLNIVVDAAQARQSLRGLESTAKRSASVIQGAFSRMASAVGFVRRQILSLRTAFLALGAGLIVRDFMNVANTLEQVKFQMVAVTKSTATANNILANTRKFATEVSFSFEEMASAAKFMTAQLKGNADQVDFFLRASADVAAVTGLTVTEAAEQFMRMMSAGAASADRFRERGVLAMMGFQAGASYSVEQTEKKIRAAFEESGSVLAGVAPQMATTLDGILSMIGDKIFEIKATLMDAGVFDFIKDAADFINTELDEALDNLNKNSALAGSYVVGVLEDLVYIAAGAVDGVVNITRQTIAFFDAIRTAYNTFNDFTGGTLGTFGFLGFLLFGRKGGLIGILTSVLMAIADHISAFMADTMAGIVNIAAKALPGQVVGKAPETSYNYQELINVDRSFIGGKGKLGDRRDRIDAFKQGYREAQGKGPEALQAFLGTHGLRVEGSTFIREAQAGRHTLFPDTYSSLMDSAQSMNDMADNYRSGDIGFRNSMKLLLDKAGEAAGVSLNSDDGIKPLGLKIEKFTGASDTAANFFEFLANKRNQRLLSRRTTAEADARNRASQDAAAGSGTESIFRNFGPSSEAIRMKAEADARNRAGEAQAAAAEAAEAAQGAALPAFKLAQQETAALKALQDQLIANKISQDEFNLAKQINSALVGASIPLVGKLTDEQIREKDAITKLTIAQFEHSQIIDDLKNKYIDYTNRFSEGWLETVNAAANVAERTKEIGANMYASLERGLETFIRTGRLNFKEFLAGIVEDYLVAQAKMAMGQLFKTAFGGGGPLSFLGDAFSYGGQSAGGGQLRAGYAYTVGERGRETFIPNTGGYLLPNGATTGGNVTINQNFDFSQADEAVVSRLSAVSNEIKEQTFNAVFSAVGQGGNYSKAVGRR